MCHVSKLRRKLFKARHLQQTKKTALNARKRLPCRFDIARIQRKPMPHQPISDIPNTAVFTSRCQAPTHQGARHLQSDSINKKTGFSKITGRYFAFAWASRIRACSSLKNGGRRPPTQYWPARWRVIKSLISPCRFSTEPTTSVRSPPKKPNAASPPEFAVSTKRKGSPTIEAIPRTQRTVPACLRTRRLSKIDLLMKQTHRIW